MDEVYLVSQFFLIMYTSINILLRNIENKVQLLKIGLTKTLVALCPLTLLLPEVEAQNYSKSFSALRYFVLYKSAACSF